MELFNNQCITVKRNGDVWTNIGLSEWIKVEDDNLKAGLKWLKSVFNTNAHDQVTKMSYFDKVKHDVIEYANTIQNTSTDATLNAQAINLTEVIKTAIDKMINFFTEFNFSPNYRFINTFCRTFVNSKNKAKDYIYNYFNLIDNPNTEIIKQKMVSDEFTSILSDLSNLSQVNKIINKRFKIYYGAQGTGKTTKAMKEANNNVMVCHSAMLPSDLMEDFKFEDGKAAFTPSALCNAMTEGKTIVLDEINLLPFESLRFLQSILDDKSQFEYKGQTIKIADGFNIIGTMNLIVNGSTFSLPEPLVDRASALVEFKLSADSLVNAII